MSDDERAKLTLPVGAAINVLWPAKISGQPRRFSITVFMRTGPGRSP
jgi:hypothetical protein